MNSSVLGRSRPSKPRPPRPVEPIECEVRIPTPRPLHVACALGGTDLGRSGIGTYVRELLPALIAQLRQEGGRLTVFGHATELASFEQALSGAERKRVFGVPMRPAVNALWHLARAGACARRLGANVLLLPAANRRIIATSSVPTVAVVHDLAQLRVDQKYDWLRMTYFRRVLLPAFRRPERLIAISAATRDDLVNHLGLSPDRIRIVYNGVNAAQFRAVDADSEGVRALRREAGLERRPYLLYPARFEHPGKNHVRLLQAFSESGLASTHTLALSGADWGGEQLARNTAKSLKLESAVSFLGYLPHERVPALVAGADAVLMLGLHEGFGLPALEGLSAGRPVCVSNTGALPEVVGALGAQCDPLSVPSIAAALKRVVSDTQLRKRCETEGPLWAERFSWTRTARGLLEACHEVAL